MSSKLKVGVVGLGVGESHVQAFQELSEQFEVIALCDIDEVKGKAAADKYGIGHFFKDMTDMCRMGELDVVDICTPSFLHTMQTKQALEAGKHVICEKPISGSLKEVDELIVAEAKSGKRIMPIFQYRYGQGIQKLKLLKEQGVVGQTYLTTVETAWRRGADYYAVPWRGKWKTELGGSLVTHAIHAHDLLYYILGPAKRVFARAKTMVNPIEAEDCVSASLEMSDGSLASLSVTTGSAAQISRHRFCFSNLSAESSLQPYNNGAEPWIFTPDTPELGKNIEASFIPFSTFTGRSSRAILSLLSGSSERPTFTCDDG